MSDAEYNSVGLFESREIPHIIVNVEVEVPRWVYDDAQQAAECWSPGDGSESIRDHLHDRIEVSPEFIVDGESIEE